MRYSFLFALSFVILFFSLDFLQKKIFTRVKWSRKATHVLSGLLIIFMPAYLDKYEILFLAGGFLILLLLSRRNKILDLHEVDRFTLGELLYPVSIGILAWLCLPIQPGIFILCTLLLAISDGFAGILGEALNFVPFRLGKNTKSLGGSITFFLTAFGLLLIFHGLSMDTISSLVLFALGLTLLEFISIWGSDNLIIPVAAAVAELYFFV